MPLFNYDGEPSVSNEIVSQLPFYIKKTARIKLAIDPYCFLFSPTALFSGRKLQYIYNITFFQILGDMMYNTDCRHHFFLRFYKPE